MRRSGHQYKSERRQARRLKKRYGMRVDRSIKSVIVPIIKKRYGKRYQKATGRLEFGHKKLARTEKGRREAEATPQKIRQPKKVGGYGQISGYTLINRGRL